MYNEIIYVFLFRWDNVTTKRANGKKLCIKITSLRAKFKCKISLRNSVSQNYCLMQTNDMFYHMNGWKFVFLNITPSHHMVYIRRRINFINSLDHILVFWHYNAKVFYSSHCIYITLWTTNEPYKNYTSVREKTLFPQW